MSGAVLTGRSTEQRRCVPGVPCPRGCAGGDYAALLRSHAVVQWRIRERRRDPWLDGRSGRDQQQLGRPAWLLSALHSQRQRGM